MDEDILIEELLYDKENYSLRREFHVDRVKRELGLDDDEFVHFLLEGYFRVWRERLNEYSRTVQIYYENEELRKSLHDSYKGNGRVAQMARVCAGRAIARKPRKSLMSLKLMQQVGYTDSELMEYFRISKTTLWRWRKEWKQKEEAGESLIGL